MTNHLLDPVLTIRMHRTENIDEPMILEPEDDGQQDEDPEGNMQPSNNAENGAENNQQQPNNDDFLTMWIIG